MTQSRQLEPGEELEHDYLGTVTISHVVTEFVDEFHITYEEKYGTYPHSASVDKVQDRIHFVDEDGNGYSETPEQFAANTHLFN